MNGWIAELKLPAVILIVLMTVWHVAQWAYSQQSVEVPDRTFSKAPVKVDQKGIGPMAGIDLAQ